MQETWVRSLGQEDPLEKEVATHSSILAWRIPWTEEPGGLQSMGSQRVRHDWATSLTLLTNSMSHTPTPEARGGGREDQPYVQEAVAARAQEGLEELSHVEGQEGQQWGDTPRPR